MRLVHALMYVIPMKLCYITSSEVVELGPHFD